MKTGTRIVLLACLAFSTLVTAAQPATQPGTVALSMPEPGIVFTPFLAKYSSVMPLGVQPLAFSP